MSLIFSIICPPFNFLFHCRDSLACLNVFLKYCRALRHTVERLHTSDRQSVWLTATKSTVQPQKRQGKLFTIPDKNLPGPLFSPYFTDEVVIIGEASHLQRAEHLYSEVTQLLCHSFVTLLIKKDCGKCTYWSFWAVHAEIVFRSGGNLAEEQSCFVIAEFGLTWCECMQ